MFSLIFNTQHGQIIKLLRILYEIIHRLAHILQHILFYFIPDNLFSYTEIFAFSFARRSPNISSSDSLNSISAPIITASAVMSIDACCKICCPPAVECVVTAAKEINVVHNRYVLMKAFSSSPASTYLRNISAQAWLSLSAL